MGGSGEQVAASGRVSAAPTKSWWVWLHGSSAQGTDAQAEACGLRVAAEQCCVALRFDLHFAGGAGRIAGGDREEPATGDQAQDMPNARGP